jgi:hypothetical protein
METFGDEAVNGPGVPELLRWSDLIASLSIPFGDVDTLDSQILHEQSPLISIFRFLFHGEFQVFGKVDQRLFDEPAHHTRVGPAA